MKYRSFVFLLLISLVLLSGATISVIEEPQFSLDDRKPMTAFPLLYAEPGATNKVIFVTSAGRFIFQRNSRSIWVSKDKYDYPVSPKLIGRITTQLADMKLVEKKTRLIKRFRKIGVEPPDTIDSNSAQIRLETSDGRILAETILGIQIKHKTGASNKGTFIREVQGVQSWLASGSVDLPYNPIDWLDKRIVNLEPEDIQKVELIASNGSAYIIGRQRVKSKFFLLTPLGPMIVKKKMEQSLTNSMFKLTFDDVIATTDQEQVKNEINIVISTFSGIKLNIALTQKNNLAFIKLRADFVPNSGGHAAKLRSEKLNRRFYGWQYTISKWKAENLLRPFGFFAIKASEK
jgi:hypothetical protein